MPLNSTSVVCRDDQASIEAQGIINTLKSTDPFFNAKALSLYLYACEKGLLSKKDKFLILCNALNQTGEKRRSFVAEWMSKENLCNYRELCYEFKIDSINSFDRSLSVTGLRSESMWTHYRVSALQYAAICDVELHVFLRMRLELPSNSELYAAEWGKTTVFNDESSQSVDFQNVFRDRFRRVSVLCDMAELYLTLPRNAQDPESNFKWAGEYQNLLKENFKESSKYISALMEILAKNIGEINVSKRVDIVEEQRANCSAESTSQVKLKELKEQTNLLVLAVYKFFYGAIHFLKDKHGNSSIESERLEKHVALRDFVNSMQLNLGACEDLKGNEIDKYYLKKIAKMYQTTIDYLNKHKDPDNKLENLMQQSAFFKEAAKEIVNTDALRVVPRVNGSC